MEGILTICCGKTNKILRYPFIFFVLYINLKIKTGQLQNVSTKNIFTHIL